MNQLALFAGETSNIALPPLSVEQRFRLWIARQTGIYSEVCEEIERELQAGHQKVSLAAVLDTLAGQPDLAASFSPEADYGAEFVTPLAAMLVGFGDVEKERIEVKK